MVSWPDHDIVMNSALPSIVMNRFGSWRASINQSVLAFYMITRLHRASVIITQIFSTNKNSAECLNISMNIHYNLQCRFEYFWSSQLSSGRNFHLPIRFHDVNMTSLLLLREWFADHKQIGMIAAYKSREGWLLFEKAGFEAKCHLFDGNCT